MGLSFRFRITSGGLGFCCRAAPWWTFSWSRSWSGWCAAGSWTNFSPESGSGFGSWVCSWSWARVWSWSVSWLVFESVSVSWNCSAYEDEDDVIPVLG